MLPSIGQSAGKIIRYHYSPNTDLVKARYISYGGETRIREFYFYDENNALEKKIVDDGKREPVDDYFYKKGRKKGRACDLKKGRACDLAILCFK